MNIGDQIKRARKAAGLTQAQLAELVGSSQGRIGDYERGERGITVETAESIAAALNTTFIIGEKMSPKEYAQEIVSQMSDDDIQAIRNAENADAWEDGLSQWPDMDSRTLKQVLNEIEFQILGDDASPRIID